MVDIIDSVDRLAQSTAKGFDSVEKTLFTLTNQNKRHDSLLTDILDDTAVLKTTVFNLDQEFHTMRKAVSGINDVLDPLLTGYRIMQNELREIDSRLSKIEKKAGIAK